MKLKSLLIFGGVLVITNWLTAAIFSNRPSPVTPSAAGGLTADTARKLPPPSPNMQVVFNQLVNSAATWKDVQYNDKVGAVDAIIRLFHQRENVAILNTPEFYVTKIDEVLSGNQTMSQLPLPTLVKIVSVMEYDFFNGQNKDGLAQEVLGPQLYEANKKRLENLQKQL